MTDRLDRIEAIVEANAIAIGELRDRQDRTQQQLDQLGTRIDQLGTRIDQLGIRIDQLGAKVDAFVEETAQVIVTLAESIEDNTAQAEIDRAEFRAFFNETLTYLRERYNGHGS